MLNTYTVSCLFVDIVQKHNCDIYVKALISEKISSTWFVVCLSVNIFCLPFSGILTWKCVNHIHLVVVNTLNTRSTRHFFVYNH